MPPDSSRATPRRLLTSGGDEAAWRQQADSGRTDGAKRGWCTAGTSGETHH